MRFSASQKCRLGIAALIVVAIASCGSSSNTLIPPVPTGSPAVATYPTTAALAYAIACNNLKPAPKTLFPGTPQEVASCRLNHEPVLLAIYANVSARQSASTLKANHLSGTRPEDTGIVDGANWIVKGPNSVLSTVLFRINGYQERPSS